MSIESITPATGNNLKPKVLVGSVFRSDRYYSHIKTNILSQQKIFEILQENPERFINHLKY